MKRILNFLFTVLLCAGVAMAQNNNAAELYDLGIKYYGRGVEQSYSEAVKWLHKAAEQGDAKAQCNLGYCYEKGHGVEKSYTEALKWYRRAAQQGHEKAQKRLNRLGETW